MKSIGIVGVGLIGGSFLRAIARRHPTTAIVAIERNAETRAEIGMSGLAQIVTDDLEAIASCELVLLCTEIAQIEALLGPASSAMRDAAILSDMGGIKGPIVAAARARVREGVRFVGAHPMFGGEAGGFLLSSAEKIASGKIVVCTDGDDEDALAEVEAMHRSLGAEVIRCTADEHDRAVAVVSHLPYLLANALAWLGHEHDELARTLAGRGFDDLTRLSRFAFDVQGEVARRNPHLRAASLAFEARLSALLAALTSSSEEARAVFDAGPRGRARRPE